MATSNDQQAQHSPSSQSLWQRLAGFASKQQTNERNEHKYYAAGLYMLAFATTSLTSGLCFGWPSLRRQLIATEGSTLDENTLSVIFTIGTSTTRSCRFFYGIARDRYFGTRITTCAAVLLSAMGIMGVALSDANNGVALAVSMFFVGLGSGTQVTLQPVAGLFRSNIQGTLLTAFSGAFQISALVFLALTAITSNRRAVFGSFAGILLALCVMPAVFLPKHHFVNASSEEKSITSADEKLEAMTDGMEDTTACSKGKDEDKDDNECNEMYATEDEEGSSVEDVEDTTDLEDPTVTELLTSAEYIWLVIWFSLMITPLQYYVGTVGYQLEQRGDDDGIYTSLFSIVYASVAAASPMLGKFTDWAGLGASQGLATILCATSFFMRASYDISLNAHTVGMVIYGVGCMLVYGTFNTNMGKRFGYTHYGTLAGLGQLLAGVISLIQYPLISAATDGRDSEVDIGCGIGIMCMLPYCAWLGCLEWRERARSGGSARSEYD